MAFKLTKPTPRKRKVTKRKSQSKTNTKGPDTFVTSSPGFTNVTPLKKKPSRGKYSSQTIIQELEALECFNLEEYFND
jgi:hypothetical protein